nr:TonB-dependent receptor [Thermoanaerobaculia bacterium]
MKRWLGSVLGVALLAGLLALPAGAQLQYGNLYGTVTDADGQALPGVTVTATGAAGSLVQVTDEKGQFRFLNLSPGTYQVRAELSGFSTVDMSDVAVTLGGRVNLEVKLTPQLSETLTVTGEAPLLDEHRQNRGSVVTPEELNKLPTARDPWSLLSQAPGVQVDRINVGGNESGQQSNFLGAGSGGRENTFAVDGVILTDMNAVGGSFVYYDFGAFEEVQFTVSSTDVTVATAGVTLNQVTKRGTNQIRGNARYLRTDGSLQSSPSLANGNEIDSVSEYGLDIGGPLYKDHLWLWGSWGESDIRNLVPSAGGGQQLDRTKLKDYNFKLNFAGSQNLSGVLHFWTNNKLKFGRGAGPTRAPEATLDQTTPTDTYKAEVSWLPSSDWVVNVLASRSDGKFTLTPKGGLNADVYDDPDGVRHGSTFDFDQHAVIDQGRIDTHYFLTAGSSTHELKFGGSYRTQDNESGTIWPKGRRTVAISAQEAGATQLVIFPRDRTVAASSEYTSLWAQDSISLDRWTISAGLRWDKQSGKNKATTNAGNAQATDPANGVNYLPPLSFSGNDAGGFEWSTIVPRLGVTYAAGEKRNTLIRGTFSQYAEQLGQNPQIFRVNPTGGYSYAYFYFTDANGNLLLDDAERSSLSFYYPYGFDPANPGALTTPNVNDKDLKPATSDELTFSLEQGIGANFMVGGTLTLRQTRDIAEQRPFIVDGTGTTRLATRDDYVLRTNDAGQPDPLVARLPNGTQVAIPIYVLRDDLSPTGGSLLTNGDRKTKYTGLSVYFQRRLANNWSARGHFTYSDWKWDIGPEFRRYDDPTDVVNDGLFFSDSDDVYVERSGGNKTSVFTGSKWNFNLNGLYQVAPSRPWGFDVGLSLTGRQGYPRPPLRSRVSGGALGGRTVQ